MRPTIVLFALVLTVVGKDLKLQPAESEPQKAAARWWEAFGDPLLNELMERAERANLDVRLAGARIAEAQAIRGTAKSALLPTVDSATSVNRLRGGFNQGVARITEQPGGNAFVSPFETGILSSGFQLRWEADVFGGLRKSLRAATADVQALAEAQRDVLLTVRAEIARSYVEMRGLEEQREVIEAEVTAARELLDLIRIRVDAGLAAELDSGRQATQLALTQALLPELDAQRLAAVHRLAVLVGEVPDTLRSRLEARAGEPLQTPAIPAAIPGDVLKRRPDVRRANADVAAAFARAGAARAEWYPKFVIQGLSGRQSTNATGLTLGAGNFFSVGPGITLPIFSAGRIRSGIAASDAVLEQKLRSLEQELLAAYEETENAYVARDRSAMRMAALETARSSARRSTEMARELYAGGLGDFLDVLDAERQQLQVEREIATARTAVLRASVLLFKALGE